MGRRINPRKVKAARAYTIEELSEALGVAEVTIRGWIKDGLHVLKSQRRYLIIGQAARDYLETRQKKRKRPLAINELFCVPCGMGVYPQGGLVDFAQSTPGTGRLTGLCPACGREVHRFINSVKLTEFEAIFEIAYRGSE